MFVAFPQGVHVPGDIFIFSEVGQVVWILSVLSLCSVNMNSHLLELEGGLCAEFKNLQSSLQ